MGRTLSNHTVRHYVALGDSFARFTPITIVGDFDSSDNVELEALLFNERHEFLGRLRPKTDAHIEILDINLNRTSGGIRAKRYGSLQ